MESFQGAFTGVVQQVLELITHEDQAAYINPVLVRLII